MPATAQPLVIYAIAHDRLSRPPRPPKLEIFVDGSNFNLALDRDDVGQTVDLNLLATRLSRKYHFVKLRYYTSPLPNVRSPA